MIYDCYFTIQEWELKKPCCPDPVLFSCLFKKHSYIIVWLCYFLIFGKTENELTIINDTCPLTLSLFLSATVILAFMFLKGFLSCESYIFAVSDCRDTNFHINSIKGLLKVPMMTFQGVWRLILASVICSRWTCLDSQTWTCRQFNVFHL